MKASWLIVCLAQLWAVPRLPKKLLVEVSLSLNTRRIKRLYKYILIHINTEHDEVIVVITTTLRNSHMQL
jgi:hypothetical protein